MSHIWVSCMVGWRSSLSKIVGRRLRRAIDLPVGVDGLGRWLKGIGRADHRRSSYGCRIEVWWESGVVGHRRREVPRRGVSGGRSLDAWRLHKVYVLRHPRLRRGLIGDSECDGGTTHESDLVEERRQFPHGTLEHRDAHDPILSLKSFAASWVMRALSLLRSASTNARRRPSSGSASAASGTIGWSGSIPSPRTVPLE